MAEYKPGTVAEISYQGRRYRAIRTGTPSNWGWSVALPEARLWISDSSLHATDVRPLVVLDFAPNGHDPAAVGAAVASQIRRGGITGSAFHKIADQIEAQTKPPRIPEPGLWAVVETLDGTHVNVGPGWQSVTDGIIHVWARLREPRLIREGVE